MGRRASTSTTQARTRQIGEDRCVGLWRYEQLLHAGYGRRVATRLARRSDVDLHVATELLARGCPIETAVRILL